MFNLNGLNNYMNHVRLKHRADFQSVLSLC